MIDNKGRIKGRVSIIDIVLVVAAIGLVAGFLYTRMFGEARTIFAPSTPFEVVVRVEGARGILVDALNEGDVMFRRHERVAIGTVSNVEVEQAMAYIHRLDGVAVRVPIEERYTMYITLDAIGSERVRGYFINGIDHIAPGSEFSMISNMLYLPTGIVYSVTRMDR